MIREINDRHEYLNIYKSQCGMCKLLDWTKCICPAFPKGIPENMLEGNIKHNKPIKGQQGDYLFTPDD